MRSSWKSRNGSSLMKWSSECIAAKTAVYAPTAEPRAPQHPHLRALFLPLLSLCLASNSRPALSARTDYVLAHGSRRPRPARLTPARRAAGESSTRWTTQSALTPEPSCCCSESSRHGL